MAKNRIYLYADGSSDKDHFGGFAWAITSGPTVNEQLIADECQGRADTTNNQMELQGVISGLKCCRTLYRAEQPYTYKENEPHTTIEIHSDSAYVVNCFLDKWYRKWLENNWCGSDGPIKNLSFWKELLYLANDMTGEGFELVWTHVRGHQDNFWNNRCDKLAGGARKSIRATVRGSGA